MHRLARGSGFINHYTITSGHHSHHINLAKNDKIIKLQKRNFVTPTSPRLLFATKKSNVLTNNDHITDVPLVFIPGMKGTHLSLPAKNGSSSSQPKKRVWLTLSNLLNLPPKDDDDPERDISLPLTYDTHDETTQHRGELRTDGIIENILDLGGGWGFLPFYGHATSHISSDKSNRPTAVFEYDWRRNLSELSDELYHFCEEKFPNQVVQICAHSLGGLLAFGAMRKYPEKYRAGGVLVGVPFGTGIQYLEDLHRGYFTELKRCRQFLPHFQFTFSSHWSFFPIEHQTNSFTDVTNTPAAEGAAAAVEFQPDVSAIGTPNKIFRPTVPGEPILMDFYNVDDWERLEIGIFDPVYKNKLTEEQRDMYKSHMTIQLRKAKEWRDTILTRSEGNNNAKDNLPPLVVCATDTIPTIDQILRRRRRRQQQPTSDNDKSTTTSLSNSLIKSIQRRTSSITKDVDDDDDNNNNNNNYESQLSTWEYDYISGRTVPGDGRIDFANAFPNAKDFTFKKVHLDSVHAKQMCWESHGGNWGTIWNEVVMQIRDYDDDDDDDDDSRRLVVQQQQQEQQQRRELVFEGDGVLR